MGSLLRSPEALRLQPLQQKGQPGLLKLWPHVQACRVEPTGAQKPGTAASIPAGRLPRVGAAKPWLLSKEDGVREDVSPGAQSQAKGVVLSRTQREGERLGAARPEPGAGAARPEPGADAACLAALRQCPAAPEARQRPLAARLRSEAAAGWPGEGIPRGAGQRGPLR